MDCIHPKALAFGISGGIMSGNKDMVTDLQGKSFPIFCMSYMERKRPDALTQAFCFSTNFFLS